MRKYFLAFFNLCLFLCTVLERRQILSRDILLRIGVGIIVRNNKAISAMIIITKREIIAIWFFLSLRMASFMKETDSLIVTCWAFSSSLAVSKSSGSICRLIGFLKVFFSDILYSPVCRICLVGFSSNLFSDLPLYKGYHR